MKNRKNFLLFWVLPLGLGATIFAGGYEMQRRRQHQIPPPVNANSTALHASNRLVTVAPAQSGGSFNLSQTVIAGGGGRSSSGSTVIEGTIGQNAATQSSGGSFSLAGGFWPGAGGSQCPTITITPATLPNGTVDVVYPDQIFTAQNGHAPYSFSLTGTLPPGLTFTPLTALLSGTPITPGSFNFSIIATDANQCTSTQNYTVTINAGGGATGLQFYPLAHPIRLLDTRLGFTGCDAPGAMIPGGTSRTQTAAGRICDGLTIPINARALTGNITTVQSGGGYLTLYPSDASQPTVANSNYAPNQILNNVFTVGLGAVDGAFNIFVTTNTNVVVDVTGYYAPPGTGGLYFHPLPRPVRLLETREGFSGCFTPAAPLQAGSTTSQLGVTTCDNVTIPAGAQALVGNATTVGPLTGGFLTFFPADAAQPLVASSNFQAGNVMNAPFTVGLSPSGHFNVFTASTTNLVIDVLGYYSGQMNDLNGQGLLFNSLPTPIRLLDTRAGFSGCFIPAAPMTGGIVYLQSSVGTCMNIPAAALAVVGNATVVNVSANGYLTFWPSDAQQPTVATSNFVMGQVFNRHFTVGLGVDGAFNRFSSRTTDLVIDLSGYFAP